MEREGIEPALNGAIPFLRVIWPKDLDSAQVTELCQVLGMDVPDAMLDLQPRRSSEMRHAIHDWLDEAPERRIRFSRNLVLRNSETELSAEAHHTLLEFDQEFHWDAADEVISLAESAPWDALSCPPLSEWVSVNQLALDTLRDAFLAPQFYLPRLLRAGNARAEVSCLSSTPIDQIEMLRKAFRCLATRAMLHIGGGSLELAWLDARSLLHHATRIRRATLVIDELVSIALLQNALRIIRLVLSSQQLRAELAQEILQELHQVRPRCAMERALDFGERLWALDMLSRLRPGRRFPVSWSHCGPLPRWVPWNLDKGKLIRKANVLFDRAVSAAGQPVGYERTRLLQQLEHATPGIGTSPQPSWWQAMIDCITGSERALDRILSAVRPSVAIYLESQDRANTMLTLTQLAAGLAVYRCHHGEYPTTLTDLVPTAMSRVPQPACPSAAFRFVKSAVGCVLREVRTEVVNQSTYIPVFLPLENDPRADDPSGLCMVAEPVVFVPERVEDSLIMC